MAHEIAFQDLSWEALHTFTPQAIALFAAAWGVLLSAETATAISTICTTIEKGHHP